MSRKNLSRTVIEGGRYHRNQYDRDRSHRDERASTRAWLDRTRIDHEEAEYSAPPPRRRVHRMFYDKLSPAMRWLDRHVGQPWSEVYSKLCATFDRRTIAGAHVVDAHLVASVWRGDLADRHGRRDFFVDAKGILRRSPTYGRSWQKLRAELLAWSHGCRAANTFMGWWWFRRVPAGNACGEPACRARHHHFQGRLFHDGLRDVPDRPLTKGDLRRLARVPDELRCVVLLAP